MTQFMPLEEMSQNSNIKQIIRQLKLQVSPEYLIRIRMLLKHSVYEAYYVHHQAQEDA